MKKISIELLNELANYLANRPWVEVNSLITKIANLADVESKVSEELKKVEAPKSEIEDHGTQKAKTA